MLVVMPEGQLVAKAKELFTRKRLIAYCDGGLGNRLNALIGGIYFSRLLDLDLVVSWPINRWCAARFSDLFDSSLVVNEDSMVHISGSSGSHLLVAHERQLFANNMILNPNDALTARGIKDRINLHLPAFVGVIYFNSMVPAYLTNHDMRDIVLQIRIRGEYAEKADEFLARAGLRKGCYWGLHLRGTDAGHQSVYYDFWWVALAFFVGPVVLCTDDAGIEKRFCARRSVVSRARSALPVKASAVLAWNDVTEDEYGREFAYNIFRDALSVREAMVDFVLLGHSKLIYTSQSTFPENARRFGRGYSNLILAYLFAGIGWLRYIYRICRRRVAVYALGFSR